MVESLTTDSSQYGDGIIGPIVFDGPASANYDEDLGPYMFTDWYYQTAFQIGSISSQNLQRNNGPPSADNLLINGTNKNAKGGGKYNRVSNLLESLAAACWAPRILSLRVTIRWNYALLTGNAMFQR